MGKFKNFFNNWMKYLNPFGAVLAINDLLRGKFTNATSGFGKFVNSFANSATGAGLTGAQIEANQFTASEAQKQRDWQTEMSNSAYQRAVDDMQAAGLNPALMYGSAGPSSTPSGASGSSVSPSNGISMSEIMEMLSLKSQLQMNKKQVEVGESQINLNKSAAAKNYADANLTDVEAERKRALTPHEVDEIVSRIDLYKSEMSRYEAESALTLANLALVQSDVAFRDKFNEVNLALQQASLAKTEAERNRILQETDNLKRDYVISFAREAEIKANTEVLSQQAINLYVQEGILHYNKETSKYEANIAAFKDSKKQADRIWDKIATGASIAKDVGVGVGAASAGFGKGIGSAVSAATTKSTVPTVYGADGKPISTITWRN